MHPPRALARSKSMLFAFVVAIACGPTISTGQSFSERNIIRDNRGVVFQPLKPSAPMGNAGLFVGVNEFSRDRTISPLRFAVHDAVELAYLFVIELDLIPAMHCYLAISGSPTAKTVAGHLEELQRKGVLVISAKKEDILPALSAAQQTATNESDLLVCAFSSHGFDDGMTPYVMPSEGLRNFLSDTALSLSTVESAMGRSKAGHRLLLVDACQERLNGDSKSFADGGKSMSPAYAAAFQRKTGQAKLSSCSAGEFSYEHPDLGGVGHGVFICSVLEALRGRAAADDHKLIRLGAVAGFVSQRVNQWIVEQNRKRNPNDPPKKQSPWFDGAESSREMALAMKADDVLALSIRLKERPLSASFTLTLREQLVATLGRLDLTKKADQELLTQTRNFVEDRTADVVFVPYLVGELKQFARGSGGNLATIESNPGVALPSRLSASAPSPKSFENSMGMKLTWIPPGQAILGSPEDESGRGDDEDRRDVRLAGFYMGINEVTQSEYVRVMNANPSQFSKMGPRAAVIAGMDTAKFPIDTVSAEMADEFCQRLSDVPAERQAGRKYRLPREAEWEYACRAGELTPYFTGPVLESSAAHFGQSRPCSVGSFAPNAFGLHDMHGNVLEWCSDWYAEGSRGLSVSALAVPVGKERVLRGGSWRSQAEDCRAASRISALPGTRTDTDGFRVVCELSR